MKKNQQGATLIVVLIFLVAITVIGTLAIRQSMIALNIATNAQVQQLLTQNSDAVFFQTEKPSNLGISLTGVGMLGYINNKVDKDKELVFCYRGDQISFFDISRASIMQWKEGALAPTNNDLGTDGYCDATIQDTNWFTSGRRAVLTQVSVKFPSKNAGGPFSNRVSGTDGQVSKFEDSKPVKIFAVSIMPSISSASRTDINNCLRSKMNDVTIPVDISPTTVLDDNKQDITACLKDLNVPFTTQVSEYVLAQEGAL
ncbi:pilus assembly PilX family protein [Acinetobacter bereziniae]|uniref:pilus assembly PilX family protein n=1 Tax=Acinetobacter bereziniae TaxID=106648 RepID=UPI00125F3EDA|nr:pilus assembly PilX N-terminal domain-containing protein [Acinetobacter bereziniae]